MSKFIFNISLLFFLISANSCSIFNPQGNLDNLIQTFFVGESGTQYYIKPIELEDQNGNELLIDMTFRYKDEIKDSASLNFTFENENLLKKLDYIEYSNSDFEVKTENIELLFNEKNDDLFNSRFSSKISLSDLNQLMKNKNWKIKLVSGNFNNEFIATNSTKEALTTINKDLFVLFR